MSAHDNFPDAVAASKCIASSDALFVGGSTTRELFDQTVLNLGLSEQQVERHYCDMAEAYGCFDCVRGCHNSFYHGMH